MIFLSFVNDVPKAGKSYCRGWLSTFDLLAQTSVD
jgi:hypothetical protein